MNLCFHFFGRRIRYGDDVGVVVVVVVEEQVVDVVSGGVLLLVIFLFALGTINLIIGTIIITTHYDIIRE